MDVVPILLAFAGVDSLENHSVDGLGDEVGVSQHREVFWEYGKQLAVREGRWELVINGKLDFRRPVGDLVHLSDIVAGAGERVKLSKDFPEVTMWLRKDAESW